MNKSLCTTHARTTSAALSGVALAFVAALVTPPARAQHEPGFVLDERVARQVHDFVLANRAADGLRTEVKVGALDARLRLAACSRVQPYFPLGGKPWGKTRVGLRCQDGPKAWNVSVPVTVSVFGRAWVAAAALAGQHVLTQADLKEAEIDLAAEPTPAVTIDGASPTGRTLARALQAGEALRESHLKVRQWFAAGETVQIRAVGHGFAVAGAGEAITAGVEGREARVRTENGRVVIGKPVGEQLLEVPL